MMSTVFTLVVLWPWRVDCLQLREVHAFASRPGGGNQASVAVLRRGAAWPGVEELSGLARSVDHGGPSAFVRPAEADAFQVRYFGSDGDEKPFSGHGTLAAAHAVLTGDGGVWLEPVFGDRVAAARREDGAVELSLPGYEASPVAPELAADALRALGADDAIGSALYDGQDLVLELSGETYAALRDRADAAALSRLPCRVVSATTRAADADFRSRCFVRGAEDDGCGIAHVGLGAYWSPTLGDAMRATQDSPRGASIDVRVRGDGGIALAGACADVGWRYAIARAVASLAETLIAPVLGGGKSQEDEARLALVRGGAARAAFIAATFLASGWSLTLFGARWKAPSWRAPAVRAITVKAPVVKTPVFHKPRWRASPPEY